MTIKYITRTICVFLYLLPLSISFAQVGINTITPAGIFHLDGKQDNTGTDPKRYTNDFVIDNKGNVGIGTTTPQARLDLQADTTYGAIRMVDGTQRPGRVFMADASGNAFWGMTKGGGGIMAMLETPATYGGITNTPITFHEESGLAATTSVSIKLPGTYAFMLRWTVVYHNSTLATTVPVTASDPRNFTTSKITFRLFINDPGTYLDSNAYDIQTQDISVTNGVPFSVYIPFTAKNINAGDLPVITVKPTSAAESFELIANDGITSTTALMFYKL